MYVYLFIIRYSYAAAQKVNGWILGQSVRLAYDPSSAQFVRLIHSFFSFSYIFIISSYHRFQQSTQFISECWIAASFSSVEAIYKWFVMFCAVVRCVLYE